MKLFAGVLLLVALPLSLRAQTAEADVAKYLAMVESGRADAVKGEIPGLLTKYPNHPGVLYLQGLTTSEGAEAVRIFQSIVDNFPASEWADDALYKVYQFYYSLGLYRTAELKLAQLRKNYPSSKYAGTVKDAKELPDDVAPASGATPLPTVPAVQQAPQAQPPAPRTAPRAEERFTLQVGAFTTAANAEKQRSLFEGLGYPVEVINRVKEGRSLFLVLVGTYASADDARSAGGEIKKKHGIDSIVTTK
jgi:cell division septation protein DedD